MKKIRTLFGLCLCALPGIMTAQEALPFTEAFDTEASMSRFTILDSNGDGVTWRYDAEQKLARYDYNDYKAADDWMFTPLFTLEKDAKYKISFDTKCKYMSSPEKVQLTLGTTASPDTHTAISEPITVMWNSEFRTTEIEFTAPASGEMCIGFHEISDAAMYFLLLDNIKIQAFDAAVVAPGTATEAAVTPGENGALTATVAFKAPALDKDGGQLSALDRIDVFRNDLGTAVHTVEPPVPGETYTFEDELPAHGEYTYSIIASNQGGESEPVTQTAYIGADAPVAVGSLRLQAKEYHVDLTWEAPTEGTHGGFVDAANLVYTVLDKDGVMVAENLNTTSFSHDVQFAEDRQQDMVGYTVYAINAGVEGEKATTAQVATGKPYDAPLNESFFMGYISYYPWYSEKTGTGEEAYWNIRTYGYSPHADAQDEDAGMMTFRSMVAPKGTTERFYSPIFSVKDLVNPAMSFYIYHTADETDEDQLIVEVSAAGSEFKAIGTYRLGDGTTEEWVLHELPLSEYVGCDSLVIAFKGVSAEGHNIHMDNVSIFDDCTDLEMTGIDTEITSVDPNKEFTVNAHLRNKGTSDVTNFKVNLYRNETLVQTADNQTLATGEEMTVPFTVKEAMTAIGENISYYAEIVSDADQVTNNNVSGQLTIEVAKPRFPTVSGLTGESGKEGITLTWNAADNYLNHAVITDDFENYQTFIIENIGNWKTVDADGANTGIFDKTDFYENIGMPMAYQVFDPEKAGLDMDVYQYTWGNLEGSKQYLLSLYNNGDLEPNDDWLISPEVADDKIISFYAKSVTVGYKLETIEVLCSDKTDDVNDFTVIDALTLPAEWMQYSYRLPEGTRYFAIRHTTHGGLGLMLDNITYAPITDNPTEEQPLGYLIYRDGQLITPEPVEATQFVDKVSEEKTYEYCVTALFPAGESYLSEAVEVEYNSGIHAVANSGILVGSEAGEIVVTSAVTGEVRVYDMAGRTVAVADKNDTTLRIALAEGAYIVRFDGQVFKVLN